MQTHQITALTAFLATLTGREPPGGLIEIRYRHPGGPMRRRFHAVNRPEVAARIILLLARRHDVYVGAAPRRGRHGGRAAVERVWALWADCDGPHACHRLAAFKPAPAIVVRSGTAGNRHAYWPLLEPRTPAQAERANRRLAHALGADPVATDPARILRPPHTRNFKHRPPTAVALERLGDQRQMADAVIGHLADSPRPPGAGDTQRVRARGADPLLAVEPAAYVQALTGQRVGRDRKVPCPFHRDATPSLHVYHTPEGGWYCFGCRRGTSVYDLAGPLWGLKTRGRDFLELRRRLAALLLGG